MAESFEERLVKAVKEHTHLYDTSMRLHFDKEALEHSWREIATYLNSDPDTCRKKWRLARDRHVRALKKSKDMPEGVPRPGSLSWLTVFIKHRQTNPNFPEISADRVESPNDNLDQTPLFSDQAGPLFPLSSFRLLVPPLRLMSAFMWQVAQERNVMHYGKLEEFVTLVTEMVPELLSSRQRTQLILGLRARMVLELFRNENPPDPQTIQLHLDRIKTSSVHAVNEDSQSRNELEASESNFVELVKTLLEDPSEKKHFFQVVFPIRYGPRYDTALQILVWEFLSRLEELLPVPDLTEVQAQYLNSMKSLEMVRLVMLFLQCHTLRGVTVSVMALYKIQSLGTEFLVHDCPFLSTKVESYMINVETQERSASLIEDHGACLRSSKGNCTSLPSGYAQTLHPNPSTLFCHLWSLGPSHPYGRAAPTQPSQSSSLSWHPNYTPLTTASCLSLAPADLEEFWHSVSDPEHLKTLLQHHRHLGHLRKNEFSNQVADNILSTLSMSMDMNA